MPNYAKLPTPNPSGENAQQGLDRTLKSIDNQKQHQMFTDALYQNTQQSLTASQQTLNILAALPYDNEIQQAGQGLQKALQVQG
jgi:hypothetical protein